MGSGISVLRCGSNNDVNIKDTTVPSLPPINLQKAMANTDTRNSLFGKHTDTNTNSNRSRTNTSHVIRVALRQNDDLDRDLADIQSTDTNTIPDGQIKSSHSTVTNSGNKSTLRTESLLPFNSIDDTIRSIQFISQLEEGGPLTAHSTLASPSALTSRLAKSMRLHKNSNTSPMKLSRLSSTSHSSPRTTAGSSGKSTLTSLAGSLNELMDIYPTPWLPDGANQSFIQKNSITRSSLRQLCKDRNIDMHRYADLRASVLAKFVPEAQLIELCASSSQVTFSPGELISPSQKSFTSLYIIRTGIVEISLQAASKAISIPSKPTPRRQHHRVSSSFDRSLPSSGQPSNTSSASLITTNDSPSRSPSHRLPKHSPQKSWCLSPNNDFSICGPDFQRLATFSQTNIFGFQPLHSSWGGLTNQYSTSDSSQIPESTSKMSRFPSISKSTNVNGNTPAAATSNSSFSASMCHQGTKSRLLPDEIVHFTALTNCSCIVIPHSAFENIFITYPSARLTLLHALNASILHKFQSFPWLCSMRRNDLELLCSLFQLTTYEPNTTIIHEGQRLHDDSCWFYVLSGELSIETTDSNGNRSREHISQGATFGEIPLFLNISQFNTVSTITSCLIFVLPRRNFRTCAEAFPQLNSCFSHKLISLSSQIRFSIVLENSLILESFHSYLNEFGGDSKHLLTCYDDIKAFREIHCSRDELHAAATDIYNSFLKPHASRAVPVAENYRSEVGRQLAYSNAITRDIFIKIRQELHRLLQDYFYNTFCSSDLWKKCLNNLNFSEKRITSLDRVPSSNWSSSNNLLQPILKFPGVNNNSNSSEDSYSCSANNRDRLSSTDPIMGSANLQDSAVSQSKLLQNSINATAPLPNAAAALEQTPNKKKFGKHAKKWTWQPDELQAISRAIMNSDLTYAALSKATSSNYPTTSTSFPLSSTFLSPSVKNIYSTYGANIDGRPSNFSRTNSRSPIESSLSNSKSSNQLSEEL